MQLYSGYKLNTEKIIIGLIIFILMLTGLYVKKYPETAFYVYLTNLYSNTLIFLNELILKFIKPDIAFDYTKNMIINNGKTIKINEFFYSINQIALLFITLLLTKSPYRNKILYFLFGLLIYSLYNTFRISIHTLYPDTVYIKNSLFNLLLVPQWIILIIFIYYFWEKNPSIKNFISKKYNISQSDYNSFIIRLIISSAIYYIILIVYYSKTFFINGELLVKWILSSVNYILNILNYNSILLGRTLRSTQAALYMDDSCVGINLIYLYAVFIFLLPGKTIDKLWFIPSGISAILLFNIIRIVLIFISIANNKGKYILPVEIHDIFTYPVLIFTFWMWTVWVNKYVKKTLN